MKWFNNKLYQSDGVGGIIAKTKKWHRFIIGVLLFGILCSIIVVPVPVYGSSQQDCLEKNMQENLWDKYNDYQLIFSNEDKSEYTKLSQVLQNSTVIKTMQSEGITYTYYNPELLVEYLPKGCVINSVEDDGRSIYIGFTTDNNEGVMLRYSDDVLVERAITDWTEKVGYVFLSNHKVYKYNMEESSYALSEEQIAAINDAIEANDFETVENMNDVMVDRATNGDPFIRIDIDAIDIAAGNSATKTYIPNVENDFPRYSKRQKASGQYYCSELGRNIDIRVFDSRYHYQQTQMHFATFAISTIVTLITTQWQIGVVVPISVVRLALTHGNILYGIVSGVEQLLEDAKLANGGVVNYYGTRDGVVLDTTVYNEKVRVYSFTSSAEYHLVVTANNGALWGEFNGGPFIFNTSTTSIMSSTLNMYSSDISDWGYCHSYNPYSQYTYR